MSDHDCPHAATLRNLLDACERGRPLADITDRLRVEVGRLAGEGTTQPDPSRPVMADGAHLFFAVYMPDVDPQDENNDPDMIADALVGIINEERVRNGGADAVGFDSPEVKPVMVSGIPAPQWLTPETLANLKRAASGEGTAPPPLARAEIDTDDLRKRWDEWQAGETKGIVLLNAIHPLLDEIDRLRGTAPPVPADGAALIAAERRRQMEAEGWTPEHDAQHDGAELALAAHCYVEAAIAVHQSLFWANVRGPEFADSYENGDQRTQILAELEDVKADPLGHHYGRTPDGRVKDPSGLTHWPFSEPWKPSNDPVRNLVRAGALIAAEIDRRVRVVAADGAPAEADRG